MGCTPTAPPAPRASQQTNAVLLARAMVPRQRIRGALDATRKAGHATALLLVDSLVRAYGETDADDALMEFLLNPEGRNWAFILAQGGTFTWENWIGHRRPESENSESHPFGALGAIVALQEYVLGVQPLEVQHARVRIRPHPGKLTFARGKVPTQRGPIDVAWENQPESKRFELTLSLPCNVRADVCLPRLGGAAIAVDVDGVRREADADGDYLRIKDVGSGTHVFRR